MVSGVVSVMVMMAVMTLTRVMAQVGAESGIEMLVAALLKLGGFAALVAVLVNIGKTIKLVPDGLAPTVSTGLNLVGLIVLYVMGIVKPDFNIEQMDSVAGTLAQILALTFGLIWQLIASRLTHEKALKGLPLIGKSFSGEQVKAFLAGAVPMETARRE